MRPIITDAMTNQLAFVTSSGWQLKREILVTAFHSRTVTNSLRYGTADKNFEPHSIFLVLFQQSAMLILEHKQR